MKKSEEIKCKIEEFKALEVEAISIGESVDNFMSKFCKYVKSYECIVNGNEYGFLKYNIKCIKEMLDKELSKHLLAEFKDENKL